MRALSFIFTMDAIIGFALHAGWMNHEADIIKYCGIASALSMLVAGTTMMSKKLTLYFLGSSCGFYSGTFFFFVMCWFTGDKYSDA